MGMQTRGFYRSVMRRWCSTTTVPSSTNRNNSIAIKQQLYMVDEVSPGSIFFLPNGTRLVNKLVAFMKLQQQKQKFEEVMTPLIYKKKLWEVSGHWENYKEDMFKVEGNDLSKDDLMEDDQYGLKPMNCPGHCIVFKRFDRSYKELPVRFSDYSSLHRNEASGALTGLTRVRRFHQDDGHIFCSQDQIRGEIEKTLKLVKLTYDVFQFNDYELHLSTRPDNFIGNVEEWEIAEDNLKQVLDNSGKDWFLKEGDGAFYGPKIDISLKDDFGKKHQVATIQLDFQLPQRFDLKYRDENGEYQRPIMIHRAIYGSIERFLALLIDHYQGKWPFWLNPRQCVIIPVNSQHASRANEVRKLLSGDNDDLDSPTKLRDYRFHVDIDDRTETVGHRIKDALSKGYSYIVMIGDREVSSKEISIRSRDDRKVSNKSVAEVVDLFKGLEDQFK